MFVSGYELKTHVGHRGFVVDMCQPAQICTDRSGCLGRIVGCWAYMLEI